MQIFSVDLLAALDLYSSCVPNKDGHK